MKMKKQAFATLTIRHLTMHFKTSMAYKTVTATL